jgi:hypothetical protein
MVMAAPGLILLFRHPCGDLDTVHGLPSGGCGDLTAEREFPSDKVYRRNPRRVIGVEPFCLYGLGFFSVHSIVGCGLRAYHALHHRGCQALLLESDVVGVRHGCADIGGRDGGA